MFRRLSTRPFTRSVSQFAIPALLLLTFSCHVQAQAAASSTPALCTPADLNPEPASPFHFRFPRDLYAHCSYQTEWWYYTGNLHSKQGKHYGFELTFFRSYRPSPTPGGNPIPIIFADLGVSDLDGQQFFFYKSAAPQVPPYASITEDPWVIQLGDWTLSEPETIWGPFQLHALHSNFGVNLTLAPEVPPVLNGPKGLFVLDTAQGPEDYEYYSIPRMRANGSIEINGDTIPVDGLAWNDHEFFNFGPGQTFPPWDWFSIQLNDKSSIMLYGLRLPNGDFNPDSRGTFVSANGKVTHLLPGDFTLVPGQTWHSTATGADYPIAWSISIPRLDIKLEMSTPLDDQEMAATATGASPSYWEGASRFTGTREGRPIAGKGYLEMLGYAPQ